MNFLKIFEDHVSGIFGAARAPFSFKKLAKQAVREMEDQTLVINGANTAPALYTILIASDDDPLLAPFYPQLSREVVEFVKAQAQKKRYTFVGEPLVRFMIDPSLKSGRFSVFAENVDSPTLGRLYEEERAYQHGLSQSMAALSDQGPKPAAQPAPQPASQPATLQPATLQPIAPAPAAAPAAQAPARDVAARIPEIGSEAPTPSPAPIPVPQTLPREQIAGVGGAAATGAALGAASASVALAGSRAQVTTPPIAQLVDVVTRETYEVTGSQCIIGRERASCTIALRDPNISRRHAQITYTGQGWSIEDLNSTNGTLVNNRRITRCPLRDGDVLTFGLSTFEFRG